MEVQGVVVMGCLTPHPPIIIPEVGKKDAAGAAATINAMREVGRAVAAQKPDVLVFFTPHGNVFADAISYLGEETLAGDLRAFGASQVRFRRRNDLEFLKAWAGECRAEGLPTFSVDAGTRVRGVKSQLDHGVMVPLFFLEHEGLPAETPVVVISQAGLPVDELYIAGMCIERAARKLGRRVVIIASGDMSHRLAEDGPYGFHPQGPEFDRRIAEIIQEADVEGLLALPRSLRDEAGECGYRSLVMMAGAFDGKNLASWIYAYQKPFGIGYLTAAVAPTGEERPSALERFVAGQRAGVRNSREQEGPLVRWARQCLETYVRTGNTPPAPDKDDPLFSEAAGVFVSLKKRGELRGCIGTIAPTTRSIQEEIRANAIAAGTRDPRFDPVRPEELDDIVYSVDVLGKPEPARDLAELNPREYGVIVSHGGKRGLLLPDLEGVDTVEEQLRIARAKAGIREGEKYDIERFKVVRHH